MEPQDPDTPLSQAERIFRRFGGPSELVRLLEEVGDRRNKSSVYRWAHARKDGGTSGRIPTLAWPSIIKAARYAGIVLTPEDMDPRFFTPKPIAKDDEDEQMARRQKRLSLLQKRRRARELLR